MKASNSNLIKLLAYIVLIIVALLMFVDRLLPVIGLEIGGTFFNVLRTISDIFILFILGVSAYKYAAEGRKWVKILFWIAVAIFVVATVLMWL